MRLVWHIVQKDLRRLAAPLALWALLLAARGEVGAHVLTAQGADVGRLSSWSIASIMLSWIEAAVCVLLVAALVHEDALVGEGAGWATRPIAGGRLLAAKLLGAVLMFGVLPIGIAVRWWLVCGYGGADMARAAVAMADVQTVTVVSALLLAVLTRNMNQFLGWLLGIGLATIAWVFALALIVKGVEPEITRGVSETRTVLFLTIAAGGAGTAIVIQFLTRQRARALLVAAGAAAALAIVFAGGWDLSGWWAPAPRRSPLATAIKIAVEHPKLERQGAMDYGLHGVPPDLGVGASADHVWRWSDGAIAAARSGWGAGSWPGGAEWRALGLPAGTASEPGLRAYAAQGPASPAPEGSSIVPMKFSLWADKAERLRTEPATYTGELHASLLRPLLEFELPLRDGAKGAQAGVSVRIDHAEWRQGEWRVTLVESRPSWAGYGRHRPSVATLLAVDTGPAIGFALVNRARGEAVKLWPGQVPQGRFSVGTQEIEWIFLRCELPHEPAAENPNAPPAWLKEATLAVVRYQVEARFDREVRIEKFGAAAEIAAAK